MSFISQLVMAFIIFGALAAISISIVAVLLGKQNRKTGTVEHAPQRNPST